MSSAAFSITAPLQEDFTTLSWLHQDFVAIQGIVHTVTFGIFATPILDGIRRACFSKFILCVGDVTHPRYATAELLGNGPGHAPVAQRLPRVRAEGQQIAIKVSHSKLAITVPLFEQWFVSDDRAPRLDLGV